MKIYNDDCQLLDIDKETGICKVLIKRPIWGVPISFLDKYNPNQFEIYSFRKEYDGKDLTISVGQNIHIAGFASGCVEPLIKITDAKRIGKKIYKSRIVKDCIKLYHRILIRIK